MCFVFDNVKIKCFVFFVELYALINQGFQVIGFVYLHVQDFFMKYTYINKILMSIFISYHFWKLGHGYWLILIFPN
jgi:hypothetical protein